MAPSVNEKSFKGEIIQMLGKADKEIISTVNKSLKQRT